jgi:hypothetical protein
MSKIYILTKLYYIIIKFISINKGETVCQRYPSMSQIIPIGNYSVQVKASPISSRTHSKITGRKKKSNTEKNNQHHTVPT